MTQHKNRIFIVDLNLVGQILEGDTRQIEPWLFYVSQKQKFWTEKERAGFHIAAISPHHV